MKKSVFLITVALSLLMTLNAQQVDGSSVSWTECTSLKSVYVDTGIFDHIGFAVPAANLSRANIIEGVKYHASSITLENETKPDTIMRGLYTGVAETDMEDFTSSKGLKIRVPKQNKLNFGPLDSTMKICKDNGLKMRGHVLVWHSQTPRQFFCQEYNSRKPYVSKDEMDARQEWYIKSVLGHVREWEKANYNDKRVVYAWDIVNEALSDGATKTNYLRDGNSSPWFAIYKSDEFIVNAFRYANLYAPKDLLLAYNDYNEFQGDRHTGYLKIIDAILAAKDDAKLPSRLDIAGMQSHNQTGWPSLAEYETCIRNFIDKGLDVQITELDITGSWKGGNNFEKADPLAQKKTYYNYFKLYQKYRKTKNKNGITGITFWGITDESSWRGSASPLLFSGFKTKPAYYGVIEAAK